MINKIGKITIYVDDQEKAKEFWTKKVNFVVKAENPMGPNMKWLEVGPSEDDITTFILYDRKLMLSQNPDTNVSHPGIMLSTSDAESTYAEMKSNGVEVEELLIMPYGKMFNFKDHENNKYMVREDKY